MLCTFKRNIYIKDSVQMHFSKAHKTDTIHLFNFLHLFLTNVKHRIKFSLLKCNVHQLFLKITIPLL